METYTAQGIQPVTDETHLDTAKQTAPVDRNVQANTPQLMQVQELSGNLHQDTSLLEITKTKFDDQENVSTPSQVHGVPDYDVDNDVQELEKENSPEKDDASEGANKL